MKKESIDKLIALADKLDEMGHHKEAGYLDDMFEKGKEMAGTAIEKTKEFFGASTGEPGVFAVTDKLPEENYKTLKRVLGDYLVDSNEHPKYLDFTYEERLSVQEDVLNILNKLKTKLSYTCYVYGTPGESIEEIRVVELGTSYEEGRSTYRSGGKSGYPYAILRSVIDDFRELLRNYTRGLMARNTSVPFRTHAFRFCRELFINSRVIQAACASTMLEMGQADHTVFNFNNRSFSDKVLEYALTFFHDHLEHVLR